MTLSTDPTPDVAPLGGHQGDLRVPEPRRRPRTSRIVLAVVLSVAALLAAVLAVVGGTVSVPAASVGEQLTQQFGAPISCTDDLPAKVGATITCTGTDDQGTHHVLVTASSVDGSQVNFTGTVQD